LALALGLDIENVPNPGFKDVNKDDWYYGPVAALVKAGVIKGYDDGTFRPFEHVTRAQMAKMITIGFGFDQEELTNNPFEDVKNGDWFAQFVGALLKNEITTGTTATTFSPYEK
jgi:hypothetical protein